MGRWAIAIVLMLLIGAGVLLWRTQGSEEARVARPPAGAPSAANDSAAPPKIESTSVARTESPPPPPATDDRARITGTIELQDGAPLALAALRLHGWNANSERVARFGVPKDWMDPTVTTDASGHFEVRFDPPPAFQFTLDVATQGQANLVWRWASLKRGDVKDLGVVRFPATGIVEGRILDVSGKPVPGDWNVGLDSMFAAHGDGGESSSLRATTNREIATFRFEAVPVGAASVHASTKDAGLRGDTGRVNVEVKAGQIAHVDLLFAPVAAQDNSRRIRVNPKCALFRPLATPAPGSVVLLGPSATPNEATPFRGDPRSLAFEDVPPGAYTIELRDPAYEPWSKSGVKPGDVVELPLVGSSSVQVTVRRRDGGALVEDYGLRARVDNATFSPNDFELRRRSAPLPAGGVYRGFVARSYRLIVEAEGFPPTMLPVQDLAANETRAVEVFLDQGAKVRGRVLSGGSPVAGASVTLSNEGASKVERHVFGGDKDPSVREAETGADGAFEFGPLAPGRFEIAASKNKDVKSKSTSFEITAGGGDVVIDLMLPGTGGLIGIVKSKNGAMSFEGLVVAAVAIPSDADWTDAERSLHGLLAGRPNTKSASAKIDATGTFELTDLPEGECDVWLRLPDAQTMSSANGESFSGVPPLKLGSVKIEAEKTSRQTFELGSDCPGVLHLEVTANGEPAGSALVTFSSEPESDGFRDTLGGVKLDEAGRAKMGPLKATRGHLFVSGSGDLWFAKWPNEITVAGGTESRLQLPLTYTSAEIVFLDAKDKQPLIGWSAGLSFGATTSFFTQTDAKGAMHVGLGPGEYEVVVEKRGSVLGVAAHKSAHLVWPNAAGSRVELLIE